MSVSLAVEFVRAGAPDRTRLTLAGPTPEVVAALHRLLGSPGLAAKPDGTTTVDWHDPEFAATRVAEPRG